VELAADADGRTRGYELINGLQRDLVTADVHAALDALADRPDSTGDAAFFGMSAGGHISYYAATQVPLAALVALYPGWLTEAGTGLSHEEPILELTPLISVLGTPVLLLIGGDDFLFSPGDAERIRARLSADAVQHEMVVYPDTPHGFFCPERDTYRPDAAADAWERTLRLLAEHFGPRNIPVVS
jgi:carboxymethylenebutenolidase